MTDLEMEWRELVAERRERLGMSQRQLAEAAAVSEKTIYNLETGGLNPRPSTWRRVREALGLPADLAAAQAVVRTKLSAVPTPSGEVEITIEDVGRLEIRRFSTEMRALLPLLPVVTQMSVMNETRDRVYRELEALEALSVAAHDEEHDIEDEQGHDDTP